MQKLNRFKMIAQRSAKEVLSKVSLRWVVFSLTAMPLVGTQGCVTAGHDFKSDTSWIKEGDTKQEDVRLILGEPRSVGSSSGRLTWTYGFYRYFLIGDSFTKELKIFWKPDGTVSNYSFNSSFPEDKGVPLKKQGTAGSTPSSSSSSSAPQGGF